MSRFDLVIFGATGFTGKQAVIEVTKVAKKYGLTWAVAGRSEYKLQALMQEVAKKSGEDHSNTKLIIADVSDDPSLEAMCRQASVIVNCCGPYRLYGEPVVRAAIHCKAHYVDVSGEPQFIETMQLKYDTLAREAGVYIVSACGMDSVPNDMGVVYMQQQFNGTLNSVESYLMAKVDPKYSDEARRGVIHYGTWESLVHSLATHSELSVLRKKLYPQRLPTFEPKLKPRGIHNKSNVWCVPFLGADASIVYRTQRHLYESGGNRPVQFKPYVKIGNLLTTIAAVFAGAILYLMSMTSFTRNILLNHPRIFSLGFVSKEGPTENVMNNTYYKFELYGVGWGKGDDEGSKPTKKIAVKVSGMNPGYGATVSGLLYSAVAILRQKDKMPANGGVMTTGTAFANTDLVKNLYDNNMKFEVVDTDGAKTK